MNIPPPSLASAPMSRRPSVGSGTKHSPLTNEIPVASLKEPLGQSHLHAPQPQKPQSSSNKPATLGQIGEKKSFFHRMLHPNTEDKEKRSLAVAAASGYRASAANKESGLKVEMPRNSLVTSTGIPSPGSRDATMSPPRTPGSPVGSEGRSDHSHGLSGSHPDSAAPSRATSFRRDGSKAGKLGGDPHAQAPNDVKRSNTPPAERKVPSGTSVNAGAKPERSPSYGSAGTPAKAPSVAGDKEPGKFNLKDLLSSGPKLSRKGSQAGSEKGSQKGSTKGSEKGYGDANSTASLFKKYGVCEKTAIGRGATAVVRLAHKWDRSEEKLYAVKVSLLTCDNEDSALDTSI